ncbi:MAG: pseudouridine synthase [Bacillota bacterium]
MERIQKLIAQSGLCSRRKAESLIEEGRVTLNGETVRTLGTKATRNDTITVDGTPLTYEEKEYFLFYKPEGAVSTTDDEKNRRTVLDFIDTQARIYPVGRLDYDTSGALLLTNDGDLTNALTHPKNNIEKVYQVTIKGLLRKDTSRKIARGITLDGERTKRAKIHDVSYNTDKETTRLTFIVTEGKYHHVKRVFEAMGHPVLKLKRTRFAILTLEGLKKGEYRRLTPHELKKLKLLVTHRQKNSPRK